MLKVLTRRENSLSLLFLSLSILTSLELEFLHSVIKKRYLIQRLKFKVFLTTIKYQLMQKHLKKPHTGK